MSVEWNREGERMLVCRIRGQLSYKDWLSLNTGDPGQPPAEGKLRALVLLEQFEGWDHDDRWGDLTWVEKNDERLERVACVGAERWRTEMEVFMLKDLRPVDIRYFDQDEEALARVWLDRE